jgi:hypothetical protein
LQAAAAAAKKFSLKNGATMSIFEVGSDEKGELLIKVIKNY